MDTAHNLPYFTEIPWVNQAVEIFNQTLGELIMKWETPAYNDVRFGFEVTMYINNK
ncbi:MAG: pyrroloquinoline quinone precursor peptide PqqA [Gammaproteobacteria bacterium]